MHDFSPMSPRRTVVYFTYMSLLCDTRAILNNYTASAAGGIERYKCGGRSRERKNLFSVVHRRARTDIYARARSMGYMLKCTFKAIQDHGRVARVPDNRHQSSNDSPAHVTYVRTKSNGEKERRHCTPAIPAEHTSLGSRFESNEGYILLARGWPEPESRCPFLYIGHMSVMRLMLYWRPSQKLLTIIKRMTL